eukprot:EG_transcript_14025
MADLYAHALKAGQALRGRQKKAQASNQLFGDEEEFFELSISVYEDTQLPRMNDFCLVPLKHRIWDADVEVGFFCREPRSRYKAMVAEGVPNIKKVVGLQRIREWYNTPTLKNHLAKSFPLFIADDTIYKKLMKAIGGRFWARRHPHPIHLSNKATAADLQAELDQVLAATFVLFRDLQQTYQLKIGRESLTPEQVAENAVAVMEHVTGILPRGWGDIQSVFLKTTTSPSLPIYAAEVRPIAPPKDLAVRVPGDLLSVAKKGKKKAQGKSAQPRQTEAEADTNGAAAADAAGAAKAAAPGLAAAPAADAKKAYGQKRRRGGKKGTGSAPTGDAGAQPAKRPKTQPKQSG